MHLFIRNMLIVKTLVFIGVLYMSRDRNKMKDKLTENGGFFQLLGLPFAILSFSEWLTETLISWSKETPSLRATFSSYLLALTFFFLAINQM